MSKDIPVASISTLHAVGVGANRFLVQWQKINGTYGNVGYTEKYISFTFYVYFIVIYHRTYYTE